MGGLTVAILAAQQRFATLRATAIVDAAVNLRHAFDNGYAGQIRAAYGIAVDGSDYAALTAGHDAVLRDPDDYDGQRFFVSASPADVNIIKTSQSDVFIDNFVASFSVLEERVGAGTHVADANFFPADELAFFQAALPFTWPDLPPGTPASGMPRRLWFVNQWAIGQPRARVGSEWKAST